MLIDTHVHIDMRHPADPAGMLRGMDQNRIDRTVLFSHEPDRGERGEEERLAFNDERLRSLFAFCGGSDRLLPVYYINPIEPDAAEQADRAVEMGAIGFKCICGNHYPGDERAMPVYRHIASLGKSILFHSGILWDFGDNAKYNRPGNWECMLYVPRLRFAMAHISWPWCDELISVYGKFCAMYNMPQFTGQQMYIDTTPGTPPCYREEVLRRLFAVEYWGMEDRLLFGSDCFTTDYDAASVRAQADADRAIYEKIGLSAEAIEKIFSGNALTFWGLTA